MCKLCKVDPRRTGKKGQDNKRKSNSNLHRHLRENHPNVYKAWKAETAPVGGYTGGGGGTAPECKVSSFFRPIGSSTGAKPFSGMFSEGSSFHDMERCVFNRCISLQVVQVNQG